MDVIEDERCRQQHREALRQWPLEAYLAKIQPFIGNLPVVGPSSARMPRRPVLPGDIHYVNELC
jgi:hypothetical protein